MEQHAFVVVNIPPQAVRSRGNIRGLLEAVGHLETVVTVIAPAARSRVSVFVDLVLSGAICVIRIQLIIKLGQLRKIFGEFWVLTPQGIWANFNLFVVALARPTIYIVILPKILKKNVSMVRAVLLSILKTNIFQTQLRNTLCFVNEYTYTTCTLHCRPRQGTMLKPT